VTAVHADPDLLLVNAEWVGDGRMSLADLGSRGRTGDL